MDGILRAWGRILRGYRPAVSVEIFDHSLRIGENVRRLRERAPSVPRTDTPVTAVEQ